MSFISRSTGNPFCERPDWSFINFRNGEGLTGWDHQQIMASLLGTCPGTKPLDPWNWQSTVDLHDFLLLQHEKLNNQIVQLNSLWNKNQIEINRLTEVVQKRDIARQRLRASIDPMLVFDEDPENLLREAHKTGEQLAEQYVNCKVRLFEVVRRRTFCIQKILQIQHQTIGHGWPKEASQFIQDPSARYRGIRQPSGLGSYSELFDWLEKNLSSDAIYVRTKTEFEAPPSSPRKGSGQLEIADSLLEEIELWLGTQLPSKSSDSRIKTGFEAPPRSPYCSSDALDQVECDFSLGASAVSDSPIAERHLGKSFSSNFSFAMAGPTPSTPGDDRSSSLHKLAASYPTSID